MQLSICQFTPEQFTPGFPEQLKVSANNTTNRGGQKERMYLKANPPPPPNLLIHNPNNRLCAYLCLAFSHLSL